MIFEQFRLLTFALWTPFVKTFKSSALQALRAYTFHNDMVHNALCNIFDVLLIQEVIPEQTLFASSEVYF